MELIETEFGSRAYGREDVNYDTWYTEWMKSLAKQYTKAELENMYRGADRQAKQGARQHLKAIEKSHSMQGNGQHRAQSKNLMLGGAEERSAVSGAIEIHELFPEHAKAA